MRQEGFAVLLARRTKLLQEEWREEGGWEVHFERQLRTLGDLDVRDNGKGKTGPQNFKLE